MDARRIETPRAAASSGELPPSAGLAAVDPVYSGPDGGGQIGAPEFMLRHDALRSALVAFEAAKPGFRGAERFELTVAARLLGWSGPLDLLQWSRRRVEAYNATMASAVREMLAAISVNNSLTRRIGE